METLINKNIKPAEWKAMEEFGKKVQACRKAKGFSRSKLAEVCKITNGFLTKIELGQWIRMFVHLVD